MTIKQYGGVFGRNPTFNDVTIEGTLTFDGDIDINSDLKVNGDLEVTGDASIDDILLSGQDSGDAFNPDAILRLQRTGDRVFQQFKSDTDEVCAILFGDTSDDVRGQIEWDNSTDALAFYTNNNDLAATFTSSGNLAFPSGQGIDFSATAGTGTSELLDDYEEGNWTPEYAPASGAFGSITYDAVITGGKYTKVGNLVHIQGGIRTNAITVGTASGGIRLSGLPFPVIASGAGQDGWSTLTVGQAAAFAGDVPSLGSIVESQSYIELQYRSAANGATIDLNVADLDTGASDNLMRFSATYISG